MPRRHDFEMPHIGLVVVVPATLMILLVIVVIFILPLNPTLNVTFKISTPTNTPPQIEVTGGTYSKSPLWSTTATTKGAITITYLSGQSSSQTSFSLSVAITYKGQVLSAARFTSITDGLYKMNVVYLPNFGEQATSPYSIAFTLTNQFGYQSTISATLYPS